MPARQKRRKEDEEAIDVESLVWFHNDTGAEYLIPGVVANIDDDTATVHAEGRIHNVPLSSLRPREDTGVEGCEDMVGLRDLHEGAILYNLKQRFHRTSIYTYIGDILISVNPYQMYNIYALDNVRMYQNQLIGKLPPHIFAIANASHYNMMKTKTNQVIVISGESGAGKTEAAKLITQYLAAADSTKTHLITEQVLETAPLLESFGNAKTYLNDNSSRFGKYIEIVFDSAHIVGAKVSEYLLEKSRIVHQTPGDRNFHIFYEMLAGLSVSDLKEMGLSHPDNYFYLNQGSFTINLKNDSQDFQQVVSAMEVLGINAEERSGIFAILAAILHLGNIYYGRTQRNGQEAAVIMNNIEVDFLSKLLHVEEHGVAKSLTQKVTSAAGERFHTPFTVEQALDSRDGLARALYSRLFTWLVSRVNSICAPESDGHYNRIGILDIFGFEDFKSNGFEQFCINYANEYLQSFLIEHIFEKEQEEYDAEKILFDPVDHQDNKECLELISTPPVGIIHILNDESTFPQATDHSFLEKCHQQHGQNKYYEKPKIMGAVFGIHHYAGIVKYKADMFLEKNRDMVRPELLDLLISSRSIFIANLFPEYVDNPHIHLSQESFLMLHEQGNGLIADSLLSKRNKFNMGYIPTVMGSFNESLHKLIDKMSECSPLFIRCIRPNVEKSSVLFQEGLVLSQLVSTGTVETIKIRQSGYPIRMSFSPFVKRYFCLHGPQKLSLKNPFNDNTKKICDCISKQYPHMKEEYQIGQTKIFMRERFERFMEETRYQKLRDNAIIIQKHIKRWIAENDYKKMKQSIVILQSYTRGFIARKQFQRAKSGIVRFQALYRMYKYRKFFLHNRANEISRISRRQKEYLTRVSYPDKLEFEKIVDVTRFDIPPDLALVFSRIHIWEPLHVDYHICGVNNIKQWDYTENTLPGDIDINPFSKFAKQYFQDNVHFSYTRVPLRSSLLKLRYADILESVIMFKLIMRFMEDETMNGLRQLILGNYIANKGIRHFELRDEIYSQLCMQTWRNPHEESLKRGWLLIGLCLCCFPPSHRMYKYLLKYVTDQAYGSYKSYCQRKLLCWEKDSPGRLFPPTLLEWKALKEMANLSLECEMADGYQRIIEVESSSSGENMAKSFLNIRDIADPAVSGWSFYLQYERSCRLDLAGSDPVLDLISVLEQPPGFPYSMAGSVLSLDRSNPIPSDRRDIVIEAHKPHSNRNKLEQMRLLYSDELSTQPQILQKNQRQLIPAPDIPNEYGFSDRFKDNTIKYDHMQDHISRNFNDVSKHDEINRIKHHSEDDFQQNLVEVNNLTVQSQLNQDLYIHYDQLPARVSINKDKDETIQKKYNEIEREHQLELERRRQEIEDLKNQKAALLQKSPDRTTITAPPTPPPLPPSGFTSAATSATSSKVNTLKKKEKVAKRTPWSLDEVLERSIELKAKRDERKSMSKSKDYMLDNITNHHSNRDTVFEETLYNKIAELQKSPSRRDRKKIPAVETYTVGEMLNQNQKLIKKPTRQIPSNDDIHPEFTGNSEDSLKRNNLSILNAGGLLSNRAKNRFARKTITFEKHKSSLRSHPQEQPYLVNSNGNNDRKSSVSAYVDRLFDPVFANEDTNLTSTDALVHKLRGGGQNYYPDREQYKYDANIYSSVSSNSSQVQLIDQLLLQQQQLQDTLDKIKSEGNARWSSASMETPEPKRVSFSNNTDPILRPNMAHSSDVISTQFNEWRIPPPPSAPPPPPPLPSSGSIRASPQGVQDFIKGYEEKGASPATLGEINIPHRVLNDIQSNSVFGDQYARSVLHSRSAESYLTYANTRWKIFLRKEIFYPNEIMNATLKHLIYRQILEDLGSRTCCRLSGEDRYKMQRLLARSMTQESVIHAAKDLSLYFSRLYRINGYTEHRTNSYLAVSHSGVRFATRSNLDEDLKPTSHFKFTDIINVSAGQERISLDTVAKKFVLYTTKASAIKKLINLYMKATEGSERYVRALSDFASPSREYLSFKRGAVIRIFDKKDVEAGCLWGVLGDYRGQFPTQIVEEYDHTTSISISTGWAASVIPSRRLNNYNVDEEENHHLMIEFARRYFRHYEAPPGLKEEEEGTPAKYLIALAEFSKEPIGASLINFSNKSISRNACDIFRAIMKFMGDLRRDKQETNADLISFILKMGREMLDLRDEIFCQLTKQTTNNKSDNSESCSRGWKLLMLCTAYFDCSQLLRPYLNKYFQTSSDLKKEFSPAANVCELNLTRSFKYGGRRQLPSEDEIFMLMQGKHAKHQVVNLPGSLQRLTKIQTSTTAFDIVKDVCLEMGLHSDLEQEEYSLFTFLEDKNLLLPIQTQDYIFDVFAKLERTQKTKNVKQTLAFRKILWYQTMRFGNNLFTEVIFNQILPNVMNGYVLHHRGNRNSHIRDQQTQNEISLLAALRHRMHDEQNPPNVHEVSNLIPAIIAPLLSPHQWIQAVQEHFRLIRHFTVNNARTKYLELISAWYYFGSSFFYIKHCSHAAINNECILAINKHGVHFLATKTRDTLLSFVYDNIISTRHLRSDSGRIFVDLKCGNLMLQRITRIETPRGKEISVLIGKYIQCISRDKQTIAESQVNNV